MIVEKAVGKVVPSGVALNDIYNARLFVDMHGKTVRWCRNFGGWFIYDGKIWVKDTNDVIKKYAIETHEELFKRLKPLGDWTASHLKRSGSSSGLNSMLDCAKAFLGCSADDFDSNEHLINCYNGTYDLEAGVFREFRNSDMITKTAYVNYKPDEKCLRWMQFLDEIFLGDKNIIEYMQRALGYSMTASNVEQCMFILYGHGRNGKSKFIECTANILGGYSMNCPSSTLIAKHGNQIPNDIARLKGSRYVTAFETNQNVTLDESIIKQLTGGDKVTARFLNKEFFDFIPTFKIFFATNNKPNIRGTDTGIWRRIHMIPFDMKLEADEEDHNLKEKLAIEYSGVFNWMIEGYRKWKSEGLNPPQRVKQATALYREEEDDLGQFIADECVIDKYGFISATDFKERFKQVSGYYKGQKFISEYMARRGFKPHGNNKITINGKQQRGYVKIRWATEVEKSGDNNNGWEE